MNSDTLGRRKPSILSILISFDVSTIAAIFVLLIIFFNTTVTNLITDTASDSMISRSERISRSITEAYEYLHETPDISGAEVYDQINDNILNHALNELEYDQSLAIIIRNRSSVFAGTRLDRELELNIEEIGLFYDYSETQDGRTAMRSFRYDGRDYIGTVARLAAFDNEFILVLSDRESDFFSQLYRVRNIFLVFAGTILLLILMIKIFNTSSATREILEIRNRMQEQGDAIQREGIVRDTAEPESYEFLDTIDLAGSFHYLNGRIESLGGIIQGIADQDLFRAALQDDESVLSPHEENMAILFLDIQGFTAISEKYQSEAMIIINVIWNAVQDIIEANGGKLNKFMGDACLVIFPESSEAADPPALRALHSAAALFYSIPDLKKKTGVKFSFRVGVDYGPVVYGKTGSFRKYELGVIGDPVNTASRLESLNKQYRTKLLVSGEVLENAGIDNSDIDDAEVLVPFEQPGVEDRLFFYRLDAARPKGKSVPKIIYTMMIGLDDENSRLKMIGLNPAYQNQLLRLHNDFLTGYEQMIEYWQNGKPDSGRRMWHNLAYNWAVMNYKYKFRSAEMFIERFVTPENYLAYKRSPQEWIEGKKIAVLPPDERWLETGYFELRK